MKNERKLELADTFPELTAEHHAEICTTVPNYIIYSSTNAVCTYCGEHFGPERLHIDFDSETDGVCNDMYKLSHRHSGLCPKCAAEVEYIAVKYANRKNPQYSNNIMVFMDYENKLYVRCYRSELFIRNDMTLDYKLDEKQRYVFCDDGYVRYKNDGRKWAPLTRVTEPIYEHFIYGWYRDNGYILINQNAIKNTYAKYSALDLYEKNGGNFIIKYLMFWHRHRNVEYLLKSGCGSLAISAVDGDFSASFIDWKQNDLRKMLGLNAAEMRLLEKNDIPIHRYRQLRDDFPGYSPETLIELNEIINYQLGTFQICCRTAKIDEKTAIKYLRKQHRLNSNITVREYSDYLKECRQIGYDCTSRIINQPRDLNVAHLRTSDIITALRRKADEKAAIKQQKNNKKNIKLREKMPFKNSNYFIRPASTADEIVAEGKIQSHCVGGYAMRHIAGTLTIAFLRQVNDPDTPYYTMEINSDGKIIQTRGKNNGAMTNDVEKFVGEYQKYLDRIYKKTERKKKTA